MRAKRISSDEQFKLIMECRQSGLSDYQWCQANDIHPGTFYSWTSRRRKKGMAISCFTATTEQVAAELQEVVKVELIFDRALCQTDPFPLTDRFMISQPFGRKSLLLRSSWVIQSSGSFMVQTGI